MMDAYTGTYTDSLESLPIVVSNDGAVLSTEIRGVKFSGRDFDSLTPEPETLERSLASFTLYRGDLSGCEISILMPIPIVFKGDDHIVGLEMDLKLGPPLATGQADRERLRLTLRGPGLEIRSSGRTGYFESELRDLEGQLPDAKYIKSCFFCLYSDYSPYGNGLFGTMMCFRNIKSEYLLVKSKDDFWNVHDRFERQVQETYLCADFALRVAGTGYRG